MPPSQEQQNPVPPLAITPQKNSWIFMLVGVVILIVICGGIFAAWKQGWFTSPSNQISTLPNPSLQSLPPKQNVEFTWVPLANVPASWGFSQSNGVVHFANCFNNVVPGEPCPDQAVDGSDAATFQIAAYQIGTSTGFARYAKDKNQVYFNDHIGDPQLQSMAGADPISFSIVPDQDDSANPQILFAKDKNNVYYWGATVPKLDPATFSVILDPDGSSSGYAKDKNGVYYISWAYGLVFNAVADANPATFTTIGFGYAKDDKHIYADGTELPSQLDPQTFVSVPSDEGYWWSGYFKDKNDVYWSGNTIGSFSANLLHADVATFVDLNAEQLNLAKDKNHVYLEDQIVTEADPASFTVILDNQNKSTYYAKDKNHVYYLTFNGPVAINIVPNADPNTFVSLGSDNGYGKDKSSVYSYGSVLVGADPATFIATSTSDNSLDAQDKNHTYLFGKVVK